MLRFVFLFPSPLRRVPKITPSDLISILLNAYEHTKITIMLNIHIS
jgi:hypothetical protein